VPRALPPQAALSPAWRRSMSIAHATPTRGGMWTAWTRAATFWASHCSSSAR
jgi:hypothetical protein